MGARVLVWRGVVLASCVCVCACTFIDPLDDVTSGGPPPPAGRLWYVSKNGAGGDGRSWASAWSELERIDWAVIRPGDTIVLDGGATEMVYTSTLTARTSGSVAQPIVVRAATDAGHDGRVVLSGGRTTPLPYCGQADYDDQAGITPTGIQVGKYAHLVFDGVRARGISIESHAGPGIRLSASSDHITFRNLEIADNGTAFRGTYVRGSPVPDPDPAGPSCPAGPNVELAGTNVTFERVDIHDGGEDAFAAPEDLPEGALADLTLDHVWVHNARQHPTFVGAKGDGDWPTPGPAAFNFCTHADGLQVKGGGVLHGLTVRDSIFGPGVSNAIIMGTSVFHDVTITDALFIAPASNALINFDDATPVSGWALENVTSYAPTCSLELTGSGISVSESVFHTGCIEPAGIAFTNDCWWETGLVPPGDAEADPEFVGFPPATNGFADLAAVDFTLGNGTSCPAGVGSHLTSVAQLKQAMASGK